MNEEPRPFAARLARASIAPGRGALIVALVVAAWLLVGELPSRPADGVAPGAPTLFADAWLLFLIFIATIAAVIVGAAPIFVASIAALAVALLTGVLAPPDAVSAFTDGSILLIAAAFLIARGIVKSGLGHRVAYHAIRLLGGTTLGLGYSIVLTDAVIAPAFPSNTARSGVLFPIAQAIALATGSRPDEESRRRTGAFLMTMGMTGLSISSALWLTAMATNPTGAALAEDVIAAAGKAPVPFDFLRWVLAASAPSLAALALVPLVVYRLFPPEVTRTPDAPAEARRRLEELGSISGRELIMAATFVGLVTLWALSEPLGLDLAAIAVAGLAVVMLTGIYTVADLKKEGGTLEVFIWFSILFTISAHLNRLGFMTWAGSTVSGPITGLPWPLAYAILLGAYVLLHYLFVSQTAQMLALLPVFLSVGLDAGVPAAVMAYMLLFATNFFSVITPQGSSANVIFVGSEYLTSGEVYRIGAAVTLANLLIYGTIGPLWISLVL